MKPTLSDLRSDAGDSFPWRLLLGVLMAGTYLFAMRHLADPTVVGNWRLFWIMLPVGTFLLVTLASKNRAKPRPEFELEVSRRASTVAFQFTIVWLLGLALLDAAIGLPTFVPGPFGLSGDTLGWLEAAMVSLLVYGVAFARIHRRLFGDR
jgi:hypothetical protein